MIDVILICFLITTGLSYLVIWYITKVLNKRLVRKDIVFISALSLFGALGVPFLYYGWPTTIHNICVIIVMLILLALKQNKNISKWLETEI